MITLYNPSTRTFQTYSGAADIQDPLLIQINMLIEQRVTNLILLDQQPGLMPIEQYRADVVNDAKNPVI